MKKRVILLGLVGIAVFLALLGWRRFREELKAIPSHGGESLLIAAIPTAEYLQRDSRWASDTVGGTHETLSRVGCTVCSLAMAFDSCGVKVTPKELNDYLKAHNGYTLRGWLKWDAAIQVAAGKMSLEYLGKPNFGRIDSALQRGQPVIAKVYINKIVPHWVLIVGKENTEYLIRDPLGNAKRLSDYGNKLYAIRILKCIP